METIQPVKFVSVSDILSSGPTDILGVIQSAPVSRLSTKPSNRYPNGFSMLGFYYSAETLDQINEDQFWVGLPSVGEDHEERVTRIRELFPVTMLCPDPRENRRKLYAEITWLRTESQVGWKYDKSKSRLVGPSVEASEILAVARHKRTNHLPSVPVIVHRKEFGR